jgi:hypothetical protein
MFKNRRKRNTWEQNFNTNKDAFLQVLEKKFILNKTSAPAQTR